MMRLWGALVALGLGLALPSCQTESDRPESAGEVVLARDTAGAPRQSGASAGVKNFVLKWRAGDVFRYRIEQISEGGVDTARTTSKTTHWYTRTVRAVRSDGSYETVVRFDSISASGSVKSLRSGATLVEQSYSSTDTSETSKRRYPQFASIIGEDVVIYMSSDGKVEQVGDVAPIIKKIGVLAGQPLTEQITDQLTAQVKTSVFAAIMLQEFVPYPKQGLDANASWVNDQVSPLGEYFALETKASYALSSVYRVRDHRIGVIGATIAGGVRVLPMPANSPLRINITSSSITGSSKAVVDVDRGITLSKRNTISMSMSGIVQSPAMKTLGEKISQSQSSITTIELIR
ncbi:MAG: hypothetical protein FGM33_03710 [Candidatus Kapabacteria bacterium]|nr:hypothetical protein [Candidatus Kapabacteria bacterium]